MLKENESVQEIIMRWISFNKATVVLMYLAIIGYMGVCRKVGYPPKEEKIC